MILRRWRGALFAVAALLAAWAGAALAVQAGLLGDTVVEPSPREPLQRIGYPRSRAGVLEVPPCRCAQGVELPSRLDAWRGVLGDFDWTNVASGALGDLALVVVPKGGCLSASETLALQSYVRNGGGLLAAGLLGACHATDAKRHARRLEELIGAEHVELLRVAKGSAYVAFRDGSPLAAGLEALRLATAPRGRAVAVATGRHPYWSDAELLPFDRSLPQGYQSAALANSLGKGRVAWLGFGLDDGSVEASGPARTLLRNAAAWAAGLPVVSLAPWPAAHRSAVLLRANLAGRPRNAAFVTRMLVDTHTRGALVVADDSLDDLAGLEPPLARAGEVALAQDVEDPSRQGALRAAAGRLRAFRILDTWPTGLLARRASPEQSALASARSGFVFYLAEGAAGRGRPTVWRAVHGWGLWRRHFDVVGFARLGDDDLGLSPLGIAGLEPEWVRRRLLADFEVVSALGGLYVLSFHTQGLGSPEHVDRLARLVTEFGARGAWVAGPAELAAWSRARAGLELDADASVDGRVRVTLRLSSDRVPQAVAVDVHPPPGTHAIVEPGAAACRVAPTANGGPEQLVMQPVGQARELRCDVRFVR